MTLIRTRKRRAPRVKREREYCASRPRSASATQHEVEEVRWERRGHSMLDISGSLCVCVTGWMRRPWCFIEGNSLKNCTRLSEKPNHTHSRISSFVRKRSSLQVATARRLLTFIRCAEARPERELPTLLLWKFPPSSTYRSTNTRRRCTLLSEKRGLRNCSPFNRKTTTATTTTTMNLLYCLSMFIGRSRRILWRILQPPRLAPCCLVRQWPNPGNRPMWQLFPKTSMRIE